jgi:hypothetical protein
VLDRRRGRHGVVTLLVVVDLLVSRRYLLLIVNWLHSFLWLQGVLFRSSLVSLRRVPFPNSSSLYRVSFLETRWSSCKRCDWLAFDGTDTTVFGTTPSFLQ